MISDIKRELNMPETVKKMHCRAGVLAVLVISSALLSACIGGGGGDSSDTEVDLLAAYDKIPVKGCVDRDYLVKLVGMAPNDHDVPNTLIWETDRYRMMIDLQRWSSGHYYADAKTILGSGIDRYNYIDSKGCEG